MVSPVVKFRVVLSQILKLTETGPIVANTRREHGIIPIYVEKTGFLGRNLRQSILRVPISYRDKAVRALLLKQCLSKTQLGLDSKASFNDYERWRRSAATRLGISSPRNFRAKIATSLPRCE
jgi:hypothetical protein